MKILFVLFTLILSHPCFSKSIEIEFPVSTIIDKSNFFNSRVTITGLNGSALASGDLAINSDGSFGSKKNIITEAHLFDIESEVISDLITSKDTSLIAWSVMANPIVRASGWSDVYSAKAVLFNHSYYGTKELNINTPPIEGNPDLINRVAWSVKSKKDGTISSINPGDTISVTAIINLEAAL
ncbi:hypothetical protein [Photobacterium damselae]|uniref:hypothetical protein n=1 Tax=Photobacterium damselae TaxID=38293 RepID=UPI001F2CB72C|nr:hypothetical protein [Photobacterium damselae]UKA11864.1 hypothetical protein IHC91_18980 [Photobacterium damselae subsp. damselae]